MQSLKGFIVNSILSSRNVNKWASVSCFSTFTQPLCVKLTPMLSAEPMKKKKKMDPAIVKVREDRKRRRLWKECRRLMKTQKQLKPVDEITIPYSIIDHREKYLRKKPAMNVEVLDERADLLREWTSYKNDRATRDFNMIDRIYRSQVKALKQLQIASPTLYEEAIKIDENLLPITLNGPTFTPPIKDYESPDGEYIDVTRKWDPPKLQAVETKKFKK